MKNWLVIALILIPTLVNAQAPSNAHVIAVDGVKAIEDGEIQEGIKMLKQAWKMEPATYDYPFEIGRALYLNDQPKKAEKYLYQLQYHTDVQSDLYILLANCYKAIDELKKTQDLTRKKELDALRYGIQKLPEAGILYLELGKRKLDEGEAVDALSVFESGIANAPNFTENYFWAAKLMKASRNHLWAWIYAELYLNMADDVEMNRTAARIVAESLEKIHADSWVADAEQMDQELKFLLAGKCKPTSSSVDRFIEFRKCLMSEWNNTNFPVASLLRRSKEIDSQGYLEAYLGSTLLESDKEAFLPWLASTGERYEAFRRWRYYNPLMITEPVVRVR